MLISEFAQAKSEIRNRLDELFYGPSPETSWSEHINQLNVKLNPRRRLEQIPLRRRFMTPSGPDGGPGAVPPEWFIGDFEALNPNEWVLVLSLNPRVDTKDLKTMSEYRNKNFSPEGWRNHLQRFNLGCHRNLRFVRPLASLAQHGMSSQEEMWSFATEKMIFLELCPYSSQDYKLKGATVSSLCSSDPGFLTASWIRDLLISHGKPRFILVNGAGAVSALSELDNVGLDWNRRAFDSLSSSRANGVHRGLWVQSGTIYSIPIVGFCQLNSRDGHRAHPDRRRLLDLIRDRVDESSIRV